MAKNIVTAVVMANGTAVAGSTSVSVDRGAEFRISNNADTGRYVLHIEGKGKKTCTIQLEAEMLHDEAGNLEPSQKALFDSYEALEEVTIILGVDGIAQKTAPCVINSISESYDPKAGGEVATCSITLTVNGEWAPVV